jgi:SM-20-related protein
VTSQPVETNLARLGVMSEPGFLEPELCKRLREEMTSARSEPATMRPRGGDYQVDEGIRRARRTHPSEDAVAIVESRLLAARNRVAERFGVELTGVEPLQFVIYGEGDYIRRHVDRTPYPDDQHHSRHRRVSAVICLNSQSPAPGAAEYAGGTLAFYEPWEPGDEPKPVKLGGEEGTLVAFSPDMLHEITPITRGERFSIVTWFV